MVQLYNDTFGKSPAYINKLSGSGSNRIYYRLSDENENSVIGVKGESLKENQAFLSLADQMYSKGISVPKVIAVSADKMSYLQEDLGSVSLYDLIEKGRKENSLWDENIISILKQIMVDLPKIQFETADGYDFSKSVREEEFCENSINWDLNYFKYCFLKLTKIPFDEMKLEEEFESIKKTLLSSYKETNTKSFLYRDFQSRNVMVKDQKPYYIDFQGGFAGPFYYDVASFLWQTRAAYPEDLRNELIKIYYASLQKYYAISFEAFSSNLQQFVIFRLLQVLGAYGYRGLFEHKVAFITPICQTLKSLLEYNQYPYIRSLIEEIAKLPQFQDQPAKGRLVVRVTSFSFKKGIPEDYSGNGGGFVFDCRAPHNPGRYPEYKKTTGLEKPVIDFLESNEEMPRFMQHVYGLVDPAVETYLRREFTSLMVNFGCTGGQHRSVYAAQHLADHLAEKYPDAKIILTHREQNIYKEYNS